MTEVLQFHIIFNLETTEIKSLNIVKTQSTGLWIRHWKEASTCTSWWCKTQELLQICSDANGTQEVQKCHGTISGVITLQPSMAHLHNKPKRFEGQFGNNLAFEEWIQQPKDHKENQSHHTPRLELEERQVTARFFEACLNTVNFFGLGLLDVDFIAVSLHGLKFLGGFVNGGPKVFVRIGPIDKNPWDSLTDNSCAEGDTHYSEAIWVLEIWEGIRHGKTVTKNLWQN